MGGLFLPRQAAWGSCASPLPPHPSSTRKPRDPWDEGCFCLGQTGNQRLRDVEEPLPRSQLETPISWHLKQ